VNRWKRGEAVVERLLGEGLLQQLGGAEARGEPWLDRARKTIAAAATVAETDPSSGCTLAYDGARFACMALLAHQGLRPTTRGGHLALEEAVRAQFGDTFKPFRDLRIRRNELEYPIYPDEPVETDEADQAIDAARGIVIAADKLVSHLGMFGVS
jgi:hypothetical protein